MRFFLRSKIHKATVTDTDLNYEGSIGVDASLMEKAGFLAGEKVLVADNSNGSRFETYVVKEEAGSGRITIYGAASHLVKKGDEIIIMGFELTDKEINPKVVLLGKGNSLV
jgi:aspartate 1-decarboxylase